MLWVKFRDSTAKFVERFSAAWKMKDRQEALHLVHDMKGVAGNIGARICFAALSLKAYLPGAWR